LNALATFEPILKKLTSQNLTFVKSWEPKKSSLRYYLQPLYGMWVASFTEVSKQKVPAEAIVNAGWIFRR
jgi:hypothetical protein